MVDLGVSQEDLQLLAEESQKNLVNYRYAMLSLGDDETEPASFHKNWSDSLLTGTGHEAIEGFRESAKTQYALRSFMLYALTYPSAKRDYIVIIKKNNILAWNKLKEIESEYITNPAVSANCKKIREQSGKAFSVDVDDGKGGIINIRIEAYGKGSAIRGLCNQDRRPKIVIIDDPQDIEDAKSETVQESDWIWFLSDVKFLGQHTRIFLIGNNLGEKCIIERVFANADNLNFKCTRVSQLIQEEGKPDRSAWPQKFTLESIYKEREDFRKLGKVDVWLRERQCLATSEETQTFHKSDYRYYVVAMLEKWLADCNMFAALDPASSPMPESCFRAIAVIGVDRDNKWPVVDMPYGRWDSPELIDKIFDTVVKWKLKEFYIEKGMLKQVLEPFIYKEMSRRNVYFNPLPLEHMKEGTKLERIKMLAPKFKAHDIWFPEEATWLAELESELSGVTKDRIKSLFIDLVDALASLMQVARAPFNKAKTGSLPRQVDDSDYNPLDTGRPDLSHLPRIAVS